MPQNFWVRSKYSLAAHDEDEQPPHYKLTQGTNLNVKRQTETPITTKSIKDSENVIHQQEQINLATKLKTILIRKHHLSQITHSDHHHKKIP